MNRIFLSKLIVFLFVIVPSVNIFSQQLTQSEEELYRLLMEYRKQKNLPSIPISSSLSFVAKTHANDLQNNSPEGKCNMHSWSDKGRWNSCCYTSDHAMARCMWDKPRELTSYKGNGYEIAHWNSGKASPIGALNGWKSSPGHNAVIINGGVWTEKWNAIGIGISENYAVVWFGMEKDEETAYIEENIQIEEEIESMNFEMVSVSPNFFVNDIKATIAFYGQLGFEVMQYFPDKDNPIFALLTCGNITFMFQTFSSLADELPNVSRANGGSLLLYVKINGIEAFYNRVKGKVKILKTLETTFYGAKEFSILDNNNYILTFAEDE
jgi:uncharacterized glyoxalase superfamily protein PhnB